MTIWGMIDRPDWTNLISFPNIGPFMLPPEEINIDMVLQNLVTPSLNLTWNLGQKDLRYLNVWSEVVACSNIGFRSGGNFIGAFSRSYNEVRDKPEFPQPDYYENIPFFPDKGLTLTAQSNNLISGLKLETSGTQLSYFRADRIVCNKLRLLNGSIEHVAPPELFHHADMKGFVDNRLTEYTTSERMKYQFEALYAKKVTYKPPIYA